MCVLHYSRRPTVLKAILFAFRDHVKSDFSTVITGPRSACHSLSAIRLISMLMNIIAWGPQVALIIALSLAVARDRHVVRVDTWLCEVPR